MDDIGAGYREPGEVGRDMKKVDIRSQVAGIL